MNRLTTLAAVSALTAGVLALSGCDTTQRPYTPRADQLPQDQYPNVAVTQDLQPWIVVGTPIVEKSGVLKVSVPVRLASSGTGQYSNTQYRFIFLDDKGRPTRDQPDWRFQRFEPRNQIFLTANSLDSNAADWRLEIRSAR